MQSLSIQPRSDGKSDEEKRKAHKDTTEKTVSRQLVQCNQSLRKPWDPKLS